MLIDHLLARRAELIQYRTRFRFRVNPELISTASRERPWSVFMLRRTVLCQTPPYGDYRANVVMTAFPEPARSQDFAAVRKLITRYTVPSYRSSRSPSFPQHPKVQCTSMSKRARDVKLASNIPGMYGRFDTYRDRRQ